MLLSNETNQDMNNRWNNNFLENGPLRYSLNLFQRVFYQSKHLQNYHFDIVWSCAIVFLSWFLTTYFYLWDEISVFDLR